MRNGLDIHFFIVGEVYGGLSMVQKTQNTRTPENLIFRYSENLTIWSLSFPSVPNYMSE